MAGKLVTIATFDQPPKARLAQNALEEAGIKSTVADETTVAMDWLLGAAIGWVKVQVMEEDAERAVSVLEETLGKEEPIDEEALAAEAEAAAKEDESEPPEPTPPAPAGGVDESPEPVPSERDEYARRGWLALVFGLVFHPLWIYAAYLFLNAAGGEGTLNNRSKNKLLAIGVPAFLFALFVMLPVLSLDTLLMMWFLGRFFR
jgi:hypothetical protein